MSTIGFVTTQGALTQAVPTYVPDLVYWGSLVALRHHIDHAVVDFRNIAMSRVAYGLASRGVSVELALSPQFDADQNHHDDITRKAMSMASVIKPLDVTSEKGRKIFTNSVDAIVVVPDLDDDIIRSSERARGNLSGEVNIALDDRTHVEPVFIKPADLSWNKD